VTNRLEVNEAKRATQLKELITALGPVFIKVPQHE
jgi:predicted unusual protein kinase regulating ubiquinone biosynthesis (AarF/ABC1/UbiB family)